MYTPRLGGDGRSPGERPGVGWLVINTNQPTPTHSRLPWRAGSAILENRDKRGMIDLII